MKNTTLSSFQKNMGQKPLLYPKTQIKFVFYVNSPFHRQPTNFFQRLKKIRMYLFNLKL